MDTHQEMITELRGLADERGRIGAGPNTRAMLEAAADLRLVRRTGAMRMHKTTVAPVELKIAGMAPVSLPVLGALYDEYELIGDAAVASEI